MSGEASERREAALALYEGKGNVLAADAVRKAGVHAAPRTIDLS